MDVKEAARTARGHILDLFADEDIGNVCLEEAEFDDLSNAWNITVSFTRPSSGSSTFRNVGSDLAGTKLRRSFKIVVISNSNGSIKSVRHRVLSVAS